MPLPGKIANKPILREGLGVYHTAFTELTTTRALGMAEGPIPWTAIDSYGYRHGYWADEFDRLVEIIHGLDNAYLKYRSDKQKKTMGRSKGGLSKSKMRQK